MSDPSGGNLPPGGGGKGSNVPGGGTGGATPTVVDQPLSNEPLPDPDDWGSASEPPPPAPQPPPQIVGVPVKTPAAYAATEMLPVQPEPSKPQSASSPGATMGGAAMGGAATGGGGSLAEPQSSGSGSDSPPVDGSATVGVAPELPPGTFDPFPPPPGGRFPPEGSLMSFHLVSTFGAAG